MDFVDQLADEDLNSIDFRSHNRRRNEDGRRNSTTETVEGLFNEGFAYETDTVTGTLEDVYERANIDYPEEDHPSMLSHCKLKD